MSNLSVGQVIFDAERVASRVKDLDSLGSALIVEAEGNNRLVESLRKFQDDLESLNRISNNKSNAELINRIQQQNAQSSEILKENRELKICLEDYEYAMELIMQKYREHMNNKVLDSKLNFREVYNDKLWRIIRQQREKINEMAAVMQHAVSMDDESLNQEQEALSRLRLENKTLRELLQISKQAGSIYAPIRFNEHLLIDQGVQTELMGMDDNMDELSLSTNSVENANNNTVIYNDVHTAITTTTTSNLPTATNATDVISATNTNDNLNNNHDDLNTHEMKTSNNDIATTTTTNTTIMETIETPTTATITTTSTSTASVNNDQVLIKSVI